MPKSPGQPDENSIEKTTEFTPSKDSLEKEIAYLKEKIDIHEKIRAEFRAKELKLREAERMIGHERETTIYESERFPLGRRPQMKRETDFYHRMAEYKGRFEYLFSEFFELYAEQSKALNAQIESMKELVEKLEQGR